jgi:3-oxoacyl-[acyl-carrier protein] reductase
MAAPRSEIDDVKGTPMSLSNRTLIVTGGGTGMGREMCLEMASAGASVVVSSRNLAEVEAVAAECRSAGGTALAVRADVTDANEVAAMVEQTVAEYGGVDVLVNNAGIGQGQIAPDPDKRRFVDLTTQQWELIMDVNLMGTIRCAQAVIPLMAQNGGGAIINLTSGTVRFPLAGISAYTTSKWAIEGLTKLMALELEDDHIKVTCLPPGGPVDTALIPPDFPADLRTTLHRPSVIRSCAAWLASDEAQMMTGRSFVACEWNKERGLIDCPCDRCTIPTANLAVEWRGIVAL